MSLSLDEIEIVEQEINPWKPSTGRVKKAEKDMGIRAVAELSKDKLQNLLDTYKDRVWVWFDTETTGLKHADPTFQVTQYGATSMDFGDFTGAPKQVGEDYNPMQWLDDAAIDKVVEQKQDMKELELLLTPGSRVRGAFGKIKDIIGKYFSPKFVEKLDAALDSKDFKRFFSLARFGKEKIEGMTIENALDFTRYYGRDTDQYQARRDNIINFANYFKDVESKSGKKALIIAHNLPFDLKAMMAELEKAKGTIEEDDKEFLSAIDYLTQKFGDQASQLDTVKVFKDVLAPLVIQFNKLKNYKMDTPEERRLVDKLFKINKRGNEYITVSLGPLIDALDLEDKGWHDALADVIMTADVFQAVRDVVEGGLDPLDEPIQGELPLSENRLQITKTRLQEIIREEKLKLEKMMGPGRNKKYDEEVRPTVVGLEEDFYSDSAKEETAYAAQAAAQGGGTGDQSDEEEKKDYDLSAVVSEAEAELTRDDVKSIVKSELQSLLKSLKLGEPGLEEKLKPSMGAGEYVKDFYKSDAPQFKGKGKKKRQEMAIAAYLDDKRGKTIEEDGGWYEPHI